MCEHREHSSRHLGAPGWHMTSLSPPWIDRQKSKGSQRGKQERDHSAAAVPNACTRAMHTATNLTSLAYSRLSAKVPIILITLFARGRALALPRLGPQNARPIASAPTASRLVTTFKPTILAGCLTSSSTRQECEPHAGASHRTCHRAAASCRHTSCQTTRPK